MQDSKGVPARAALADKKNAAAASLAGMLDTMLFHMCHNLPARSPKAAGMPTQNLG